MRLVNVLGVVVTGVVAGGPLAGCLPLDGEERENHAPVVHPISVTAREDHTERFTIRAEDVDGDVLTLRMPSPPAGYYELQQIDQVLVDGTNHLEAELRFWAFDNLHGEFDFDVTVSDGVDRASATVTVTILSENDRPTARDDAFATVADTPLVISSALLLANDDDAADVRDAEQPPNHGLTLASVGPATRGEVTLTGAEIRFVPEPGFLGTVPFTYRITDGEATADATVRVLVGGPNGAPRAVPDETRTMEGEPLEIDVGLLLANDHDDDGHTLAVVAVGNPEHGTVELRDGVILFTPQGEPGGTFFGTAGFDYTITDGAATSTGHVVVEVAPWI